MNIRPLIAKRLKHCAYILVPSLMIAGALFLLMDPGVSRAQPADGTQTLVFMRHAEKPAGGLGQLNCQGQNRALMLATLLPEKFGKANYVFAANPARKVEEGANDNAYSYLRPLLTISPSAIKLGLPVNLDYSANDTSDLAEELLQDKYHNSVIYTAWSHGYLPELMNKVAQEAIGKEHTIVDDWASSDFDSLYVLTLTWHNGKATLHSHSDKQGLDNGAASCPI